MCFDNAEKKKKNNGTKNVSLVTPTPEPWDHFHNKLWVIVIDSGKFLVDNEQICTNTKAHNISVPSLKFRIGIIWIQ